MGVVYVIVSEGGGHDYYYYYYCFYYNQLMHKYIYISQQYLFI